MIIIYTLLIFRRDRNLKNKFLLLVTITAFSTSLTACSSNSTDKTQDTSNKQSTVKISKNNSAKKSVSSSKYKKQYSSSSKISSSSSSFSSSSTGQVQSSSSSQSSNQTEDAAMNYSGTLTDFVNTYGESPVAYKIDHGMSEEEAYRSTPDDLKSSGEIQYQNMKGWK